MKNKEKYLDDIFDCLADGHCTFLKRLIPGLEDKCDEDDEWACEKCKQKFKSWLEEEYIEKPYKVI